MGNGIGSPAAGQKPRPYVGKQGDEWKRYRTVTNMKTAMRIDAHQHFWDVSKLDYPWMPPGDSVLRRNYMPEELAPILAQHHFDGSVVVQANVVMEETWWLLDLPHRATN